MIDAHAWIYSKWIDLELKFGHDFKHDFKSIAKLKVKSEKCN